VNYSNGLYVCTPEALPQPYKFFVGEGNNSNLIRGIMRRRFWWAPAASKNEEGLNLLWTQLKFNAFFSTQEPALVPEYFVVERMESEALGALGRSGSAGGGDGNRKLFGRLDYKIWRKHLELNEKSEKKISELTYQRRIKLYEKKRMGRVDDSRTLRVHNHLENNFYIGNKKAIYYNLKRYLELKGEQPFGMLPLTFHITRGVEDPEYLRFLGCYEAIEEERRSRRGVRNVWIVKPGENTNRGNGITVCYGLDDIKVRLRGRERNGDGKLRTFILQKYIENPMLYHKRKFDLRHYVLLACTNGAVKAYWFEEGYVRTSSSEFNLKPSKDCLAHLTNDAIQKHTPDYGKYEKGNKLSYAELQKYLDATYPSRKFSMAESFLPKMKHFATEAVKATYALLDPARRKNNFELLGLDFMMDEDFEPWLIEVNTNPCLELSCPLLRRIIPAVIENTFKLCIDPLFPPPEVWPSNRKLFFGEDPLAENRFELIFDESSDGMEVERLFEGKERVDAQLGRVEEDEETFENEGEVEWEVE
jgi:tubulin polyglutamylase TTLL1